MKHWRLRLELLGLAIEVRSGDAAALRTIGRALRADAARATHDDAAALVVTIEATAERFAVATTHGSFTDLDLPPLDSPSAVVTALVLWAATHTERFRVLHAGAVARDGAGILLPAPTHHGKSTMTAALVQRGYQLLSDEIGAVAIDDLAIHPFAREICLRDGALAALGVDRTIGEPWDGGRARLVSAEALGGTRAPAPVELALTVFLHYQDGTTLAVKRFAASDAFRWLHKLTPAQRRTGTGGFDAGVRIARDRPCYRLVYSDVIAAEEKIRELLRDCDRG